MSYHSYNTSRVRGSYAGDRRPYAGEFHALGVDPDATWDEVREAYLDLVRVWHPDRFQSDPQLRDKAQRRLQQINEAYHALKSAPIFDGPLEPPPEPAPHPTPAADRPAAPVYARAHRRPFAWVLGLPFEKLLIWAAGCLLPLLSVALLINSLRVPSLDSVLTPGSLRRPTILMPSRMLDQLRGGTLDGGALADWARREGEGVWRSLPKLGDRPSAPGAGVPKSAPNSPDSPPDRGTQRPPGTPANGTEVAWEGNSGGAGELRIINQTGKDVVATLVRTGTTEPLRAIYIQANHNARMRNIAVGVDDLVASAGDRFDRGKFRFLAGSQPLGRAGPFAFYQVTSARGSTGPHYEVLLTGH